MITDKIKGDKVIWTIAILLSILSLLAVYSSTGLLAYLKQDGNTEYYLFKQFVIIICGFALMYFIHLINYVKFEKIVHVFLVLAIILLVMTMLFGPEINYAKRYLKIPGTGLTFQTSDFAKLAIIMFIARFLVVNKEKIKSLKGAFIPIVIPILLVCGLILPEDLSTSVSIFLVCLCLLFFAQVPIKYIAYLCLIGIAIISILFIVSHYYPDPEPDNPNSHTLLKRVGTWKSRILTFFQPGEEEHQQVFHAKIAVASGGLLGKMPGNSTQKFFVPHPYSDFVYAIIIEEYGLAGGTVIMLLFLTLLFRSIRIARQSKKFGAYLVIGISLMMVVQAMINMGVAVNLLPVTGQTLPFISMGGTSFWFSCIGIGIILSVSKSVNKQEQEHGKKIYAKV